MRQKDKVTIYDISKKLNISAATVSRALNNSDRVSQKTLDLVLKTAKELNYQQNTLALALKSGRTNNVGVVVPYINHNFFASVIRGIEEELTPVGYHVIICQTHENVENEIRQIQTLLNTHIDGIFMSVSKSTQDTSHIKSVLDDGVPLIFFDRKKDVPGVSSVTINDFQGGFLATDHLIKQGCKRIAHLSGDLNLEIYLKRYEGYLEALRVNNIPVDDNLILEVNSKLESGAAAAKKLWALPKKIDAIFSSSDYAALGAIQQLKLMQVGIPDEVSVAGFSNEPFTQYMELPITSIDQTPVLMGKIAAQVFLEQIKEKREMTVEKKVVLTPELHVRDSSKRSTVKSNQPL
ncbi:MAG: LacI family DNA-binding transcriptional regulator [Leeuwenhoekiella sp.]